MSGVYVAELECTIVSPKHLKTCIAAKADGDVNSLRWKDWHKCAAVTYWVQGKCGSTIPLKDELGITGAEFSEWVRLWMATRETNRRRLKGYAG